VDVTEEFTSKTCMQQSAMSTPAWVALKFSTVRGCGFTRFAGLERCFWDFPESFAGYRLYHFYR
jgi:hypothetical protein